MKVKLLSRVQLFVTPLPMQFMEFSRPEYWSGKPFPSPGDVPNPGIEPWSPSLQADFSPVAEQHGKYCITPALPATPEEKKLSRTSFRWGELFFLKDSPPLFSLGMGDKE